MIELAEEMGAKERQAQTDQKSVKEMLLSISKVRTVESIHFRNKSRKIVDYCVNGKGK